jgi:hypothetical protein
VSADRFKVLRARHNGKMVIRASTTPFKPDDPANRDFLYETALEQIDHLFSRLPRH